VGAASFGRPQAQADIRAQAAVDAAQLNRLHQSDRAYRWPRQPALITSGNLVTGRQRQRAHHAGLAEDGLRLL
jgi:hypothetical protein